MRAILILILLQARLCSVSCALCSREPRIELCVCCNCWLFGAVCRRRRGFCLSTSPCLRLAPALRRELLRNAASRDQQPRNNCERRASRALFACVVASLASREAPTSRAFIFLLSCASAIWRAFSSNSTQIATQCQLHLRANKDANSKPKQSQFSTSKPSQKSNSNCTRKQSSAQINCKSRAQKCSCFELSTATCLCDLFSANLVRFQFHIRFTSFQFSTCSFGFARAN